MEQNRNLNLHQSAESQRRIWHRLEVQHVEV